jgi:hypothetical protein
MSVRRNVRSAKRPFGKTSVGKMSFRQNVFRQNVLRQSVFRQNVRVPIEFDLRISGIVLYCWISHTIYYKYWESGTDDHLVLRNHYVDHFWLYYLNIKKNIGLLVRIRNMKEFYETIFEFCFQIVNMNLYQYSCMHYLIIVVRPCFPHVS